MITYIYMIIYFFAREDAQLLVLTWFFSAGYQLKPTITRYTKYLITSTPRRRQRCVPLKARFQEIHQFSPLFPFFLTKTQEKIMNSPLFPRSLTPFVATSRLTGRGGALRALRLHGRRPRRHGGQSVATASRPLVGKVPTSID